MAQFNAPVLTTRGLALMTKAQAGECQIEFTKIAGGDGTWGSTDLTSATALINKVQESGFTSVAVVNGSTIDIVGILSNIKLTEAYFVREIGFFAKEKSDTAGTTEVLYAIMIAPTPSPLPAYNGVSPQTLELETYLTVSGAETVTIDGATGALASAEDVRNLIKRVDYLESLVNPIITTGKVTIPATTLSGDNLVTLSGDTLNFTKKIGG